MAIASDRTAFLASPIEVLPSGVGVGIQSPEIRGNAVNVEIHREPMTRADWTTHDYNVHFCVGLRNRADVATTVELSVDGGTWEALPRIAPLLFASDAPHGPFRTFEAPARTDLGKRYAVRVTLAPNQTLYVANTLVRNLDDLRSEFDRLAEGSGAQRWAYGHSLDGRELVAYRYGAQQQQGTILVTSGFHPPEPDTLGTAAIMEWLGGDDGRALRERLAVVIVPIANPDGYARGTQAANAAGINFYWHFARELPDRCPEAAALWALASDLAPRGYIDFHAYTFQSRKAFGPYVRPALFYSDYQIRAVAAQVYRRMVEGDGGTPVAGFGTYAPHTLGSMLASAFDTITAAKFHLHLKDGVDGCRRQALDAFRTMTDELISAGLTARGGRAQPGWRGPLRLARVLWAGCMRPNFGLLRRGRFSEVRLARTGLDPAEQRQ